MPILMIVAILAAGTLAVTLRKSGDRTALLFTAGGLLTTVFVLVLTWIVNVPINDALMTWSVSAPPADRLQLWAPWEQAHTVRTLVALAGFCCHVLAVMRDTSRAD